MTEPVVYTVTELMARWNTSRKSILRAIHEERLTAFKVGSRKLHVRLDEVLRFEQQRAA